MFEYLTSFIENLNSLEVNLTNSLFRLVLSMCLNSISDSRTEIRDV